MTLTLEKAIELWHGNGYRKIQHYLEPKYRYRAFTGNNKTLVESYKVKDIVNMLKSNMIPDKKDKIYYRGEEDGSVKLLKKKTFISVSTNIEHALSFSGDECCLYKVMVDKNVKRLKTGVENEILLENNCCLEYVDHTEIININGEKYNLYSLKIYPPSSCENQNKINNKRNNKTRNNKKNNKRNNKTRNNKINNKRNNKITRKNRTNIENSNAKIKRMLEIIPVDEYNYITDINNIPNISNIILTPEEKIRVFEKIQQIMKNIKKAEEN